MKSSLTLLSFLIFAFATRPLPVLGDASHDPVLDITGKKIRAGTNYYILPVSHGSGGGLTLASTEINETCPLDVVQEKYERDKGLPLRFSPVNPKKGIVRESTDVSIKFDAKTGCAESTVWKLDYDESLGETFVTTGGAEGNPDRNVFKIEKYDDDDDDDYKLVWCPTVCESCNGHYSLCSDVGIYIDGEMRRLALSDAPFKVAFKKA